MASLLILAMLLAPLPLYAFIIARMAGVVGSSRAQFRRGMLAIGIVCLLNLAAVVAILLIPRERLLLWGSMIALVVLILFGLVFLVFRRVFQITAVQTLAPMATYIVLNSLVGGLLAVSSSMLIQSFIQTSRSAAPAIEAGDCITVYKLASFERGDLIAYWSADSPPAVFVHRLVGLPGDQLKFSEGRLYVNEQEFELPPGVSAYQASPPNVPEEMIRYRNDEVITLGSDEFFVIGDNVDLSYDSRLQGPVPRVSLVGVADFRYWPLDRAGFLRQ